MQASHTCFSCSAIRAEDVRRRVARSGQHGSERPEQFFIDKAEEEDADASPHWTRGDYTACADVEGQRACQCERVLRGTKAGSVERAACPIHVPGEDAPAQIQNQNLAEISHSSKGAP
jgi:hypothetical protein